MQCYDLVVAAQRQAIAFLHQQIVAIGLEIEQVRCAINIANVKHGKFGNQYGN